MDHKPLIILDRDGVINFDSDEYIKSVDEWIPIPGSIEAIGRLSQAGYRIAVATNQSGVGRGYYDLATLQAMHDKMQALVEQAGGRVDVISYCPHIPEDNCTCRKPLPGLILDIQEKLQQPVAGAYMVGDSIRDLEAGVAVGCHPVLVLTGKGEKSRQKLTTAALGDVPVYANLSAFVDHLLAN